MPRRAAREKTSYAQAWIEFAQCLSTIEQLYRRTEEEEMTLADNDFNRQDRPYDTGTRIHVEKKRNPSWLWLLGYYAIMTMGEIQLYPVGLSLFSKAAPARMVSLMMGLYFVPNFLGGGFLQGWLGTFWEKMDKAAFFIMIAGVAAAAAVIIRLLERPLRQLLKDAA